MGRKLCTVTQCCCYWHYQKLTMGIPNEEKPQRDRGITAVETFLQAVDRACIVFNLKTGTIIIGIINIILCLTFAVKYMVLLVSLVNDVVELLDRMKQEPHESDGASLGFSIIGFILYTIILTTCGVSIIIASILIHGARTGRPGFLIPWLSMIALFMMFQLV